MQKYIPLCVLLFMGTLSMYFYYIYYPIHGESKSFLLIYFLLVAIVYGGYKFISTLIGKNKTHITALGLILFFLAQLFLVSICFFAFTVGNVSYGFILFFKILFFLIPISLLWLNLYCLGDTILQYFKYVGIENKRVQILSSIGTGFTVFMLGVFMLISFSFYNAQSVLLVLLIISIISYKSWIYIFTSLKTPLKTYAHNIKDSASFSQRYNLSLLIDEFHFLIITFLMSVNLISVYRPFPIGWDDLGAYMNYPKLLSGAGEHLALGKMYLWELYTGIGFLFGSQTLAFYLNSFSGIIAAIIVYLGITSFIGERKTRFDFGLFSSMILVAMPMVVFQLAKDMKLDLGLLSISVIALSLFYELVFMKGDRHIGAYILLGALIGTAFAIKLTSLLLLLGIIAALFYTYSGLGGFFAFLGMFFAIFSYLNLWGMMNVVVPNDIQKLKYFAIFSLLTGVCAFAWSHVSKKKSILNFVKLSQIVGLVLLGFVLVLLPWGIKNISEVPQGNNIGVGNIIAGQAGFYSPDYTQILSSEEIEEIQQKLTGLTESGLTDNEDLGRYFGYETGINNYLKLPWNLTFQVNQRGEFTDITYIFFALLPALFLFLPYRKTYYIYPVVAFILVGLLYFIPSPVSIYMVDMFSSFRLPGGYGIIGCLFLLPLIYLHFTLNKDDKIVKIFLANLTFTSVYLGLWAVSAFGIVWYGMAMYFALLLMISLCLIYIDSKQEDSLSYSTYTILLIVWVYLLQSAIPHGMTNLRNAGYPDYKLGGMTEEVALITFHPEYFSILFELNISDKYKQDLFQEYRNMLLSIVDNTEYAPGLIPNIQGVQSMTGLHDILRQIVKFDLQDQKANNAIDSMMQSLYDEIIYVNDNKNTKKIHRIGTFLKYYISENNTRLFEDSLLTNFHNYLYTTNISESIDKLKKLDVGYILLDINAATIDKDPERKLTRRYENMLKLVTHEDLSLIDTDSMCLRVALDTYRLNGDIDTYIDIAGVNYSYTRSSAEKKMICIDKITEIITDKNKLGEYPYLKAYVLSLERANVSLENTQAIKQGLLKFVPNGYKALFKIGE